LATGALKWRNVTPTPGQRCCREEKVNLRNLFAINDLQAGDLGFEPRRVALRRDWSDVANALLFLQMRRIHRATILNQHWAHTGNSFPCFSPAVPDRTPTPSTRFWVRRVYHVKRPAREPGTPVRLSIWFSGISSTSDKRRDCVVTLCIHSR